MTAETFTPEHARLIYNMYRKALRKVVNVNPRSRAYVALDRQFQYWGRRWMAVPNEVVAKAF